MKKVVYQLETLACPSCSQKIDAMLKQTAGIGEHEVLFNSSRVRVAYDEAVIDSETIRKKLRKLGFLVLSEK